MPYKNTSVVVGSWHSVSHSDHMATTICTVDEDDVQKRLLGCESSSEHKWMIVVVSQELSKLEINIQNARGQPAIQYGHQYGDYSRLWANLYSCNRNQYMDYVPCAPCLLNVVDVSTFGIWKLSSDVFSFLHLLYNFYVSSMQHWRSYLYSFNKGRG
jgi:hypothetical protein